MARRIRSIKPDFWEHEGIAGLTPLARLLYVATWNLADDEGLLRWTPAIIRAQVFPYDDPADVDVPALMAELQTKHYVHPYRPGNQPLGWIVNFRKHQRINRPQPSRLIPPDLDDDDVRWLYGDRDDFVCHRCREVIAEAWEISVALIVPLADGGTAHPSNVVPLHGDCQPDDRPKFTEPFSERGSERRSEPFTEPAVSCSVNGSVNDSLNFVMPMGDPVDPGTRDDLAIRRSLNSAVNGAVNGSLTDREGERDREVEGEGERAYAPAADAAPPRCRRHANLPIDDPGPACVGCRSVRLGRERAATDAELARAAAVRQAQINAQLAARRREPVTATPDGRRAAQDAYRASQARKRGAS